MNIQYGNIGESNNLRDIYNLIKPEALSFYLPVGPFMDLFHKFLLSKNLSEKMSKEEIKKYQSKLHVEIVKQKDEFQAWLKLGKKDVVLDIGTGGGYTAFALSSFVSQVIGIDKDEGMIKLARQNLRNNEYANIKFQVMPVEDLNFKHNMFDLVTLRGALRHFHDPILALVNINKTLKKGGRIYIYENLTPRPIAEILSLIGFFRVESHKWYWEREEIENLLLKTGFQISDFKREKLAYSYKLNKWLETVKSPELKESIVNFLLSLPADYLKMMGYKNENNEISFAYDLGSFVGEKI
ncbi:MAG: class I SAM-dependent methyltransferase [Ignavibacteriaceae bacterium]